MPGSPAWGAPDFMMGLASELSVAVVPGVAGVGTLRTAHGLGAQAPALLSYVLLVGHWLRSKGTM